MKLSVSNVAWYNSRIDEFIRYISSLGCTGIELGPSMIWPEPVLAPIDERQTLKRSIADAGLELAGIQALLYSRPDLVMFGDATTRSKMLEYLTHIMDLCLDLGGEVMVFGSPRNRLIGHLPRDKARSIAIEFFRELGIRAGKSGTGCGGVVGETAECAPGACREVKAADRVVAGVIGEGPA